MLKFIHSTFLHRLELVHSLIYFQLFNLKDTKENQTNSDSSLWNEEEAIFVAKLAQTVCSKLALEACSDDNNKDAKKKTVPKTCGIITFYQKQRSTICLELRKLGIKVEDDLNQKWSKKCEDSQQNRKSSQTVSVKTVDGFQVYILFKVFTIDST